jgi:hypothetical protein
MVGLIAMLLMSAAAQAQLLKCIGKDGRVEYASQCPPGSRAQDTGIKSTPASPPASSSTPQKSLAERDAEFRKRQMEKQEAEAKETKKLAEDSQRKRACDDARAYLKSLEARNRVAKTDPKTGERIYLEEADYQSEIAAAQRSIQANCK